MLLTFDRGLDKNDRARPASGEGNCMPVLRQNPKGERDTMAEADVLANQREILANQKQILGNQQQILDNQDVIKKNQEKLDIIIRNQEQILALVKK
jgi:hypothetical protein